jgi:hypothetical protein
MVVAALLALLFVGRRLLKSGGAASDGPPALAPRPVRRIASLGVAAAGIYLVVVRASALF